MPFTQYNDISAFNLSTLQLNDIRWLVGTGQGTSTGQGKKQKTAYRQGVLTPIGDVRLDVWYELTEAIIRRDGEQPLLDSLVEWLSAHNYTEETPAQIHYHALELHSSRLFDRPQWVDYIPFNRLYRPEHLEQAHIVTIIPACCPEPGQVTQEQIDGAYCGMVACPHCGRWSPYLESGPDSLWENW